MNGTMKRRLTVVSAVVVALVVATLFLVGGKSAAQATTIADAVATSQTDRKIQVSGNVVEGSYTTEGNILRFSIYDPEGDPNTQLEVEYKGAASSTFGNDVVAICTGRLDDAGTLQCAELITKCPSKYEELGDEHPADVPIEG